MEPEKTHSEDKLVEKLDAVINDIKEMSLEITTSLDKLKTSLDQFTIGLDKITNHFAD